MVHYHVWVDPATGVRDLEVIKAAQEFLQGFIDREQLVKYTITRRTFGFGPAGLGEFLFVLTFENLSQMDLALGATVTREGEVERVHAALYQRVTNLTTALYRDFPDKERMENITIR